ncbi:uncharacterized protein METZ01_LOCUS172591, partial [marine metagenome]
SIPDIMCSPTVPHIAAKMVKAMTIAPVLARARSSCLFSRRSI